MEKLFVLICLMASVSPAFAEPSPDQAPLALFTVNSPCNDTYDDALVSFALQLAAFASEERLGRAQPGANQNQLAYRSEMFRQHYANCRKAEIDYEMSLVDPAGNPARARAAASSTLASFRGHVRTVSLDPRYAFSAPTAADQRWSAELEPRLRALFVSVRARGQHLRSSQHLRKAMHTLIDQTLQRSVDCRVLEKNGQSPGDCATGLRAALAGGEAKVAQAAAMLAGPYAKISAELAVAEAARTTGAARASSLKAQAQLLVTVTQNTESRLKKMMEDRRQLDLQARTMDYLRWLYLSYGNWPMYSYYNHAFVTITQQLIPGLMATVKFYENQLYSDRQKLASLTAEIEAADRQLIALVQAVHFKRQQLVSTCLPAAQTGASTAPAPLCQSFTGIDMR